MFPRMRSNILHDNVVKWAKTKGRTRSATPHDFSDDPVALSDVGLLPVLSCFVCDRHFGVSGPFSRYRRLGAPPFSICDLPRLQRTVSLLCGLPPFSVLMLHSPRGSSCRRVHDLLSPSIHGLFSQCPLLPSAHTLRVLDPVSPFLWRSLSCLHTGPRPHLV